MDLNVFNETAAQVKGWIDLALVNRDGKVTRRHRQENLVLNAGLNYILSELRLDLVTAYVAVGTGNTPPDPNQTALANEVARTSQTLNMGPDIEVAVLGDGHYRVSRTRAFNFNEANGTLREFGGAQYPSGLLTRDLFRDEYGNPIAITKTNQERLVITYHIEVKFAPTTLTTFGGVQFRDNNGNVVATRTVSHMFARNTSDNGGLDLSLLGKFAWSQSAGKPVAYNDTMIFVFNPSPTSINNAYTNGTSASTPDPILTLAPYTNGTYYRDFIAELGPEAQDRTIYGYVFSRLASTSGTTQGAGYRATFVDANGNEAPFTKDKDYRLKFAMRLQLTRL